MNTYFFLLLGEYFSFGMSTPILIDFYTFISLFLLISDCAAFDKIYANQDLKDGTTIVSDNNMYELGFFSPGKSNNRYLGIWLKKISNGTVVWVANRVPPVTDRSGMLKFSTNGSLVILNGNNTEIWSSCNSILPVNNLHPVAQLLNTGNLIVWDNSSANRYIIWQSFDYPGNTELAGMKIGKDLVTGINRNLTSWKSHDDPSPGPYVYSIDTNGYPQIFQRQDSVLNFRLGPWNGVKFHGTPINQPNRIYKSEFIVNHKEIYVKFELKSSDYQRVVARSDGSVAQLLWIERTQEWIMFGNIGTDTCSSYGICGPYGSCNVNRYPPCSCMEGFVPKLQIEWNNGDWSSGCKHKVPLRCDQDRFKRVSGLKFPDTRKSTYNMSMTLGECEMACQRDCSCSAYANLDVRNGGSGCLLWFDELMDIREYHEDHNIFIRMSASELLENKNNVVVVVLAISSAALLLSAVAYASRNITRLKKKNKNIKGDKRNRGVLMEDLDELPFFSLNEIVEATDNFNIDNKIGEGGFGPVYKGVLKDGREVAVKRLSETSQQGLGEFKNEVICIAKLQHRNLVKLLGYCIHGNEMILIYEYLANKSLDSFIFDDNKSLLLEWPRRFKIIHGMARGILYLHQDSRLQIIHRDLKASNILLDDDMNPKISDFGLARNFVGFDDGAKTKKVVGTYGYISPEYAVHGRYSIKSDVFSFGVILLEIVSGMKNREFSHEDHSDNLLGHAWRLYKEDKSIELMSASLRNSCIISEVKRSIHVALLCVQHRAEDRPTMLSVVLMLVSEGVLPEPKQPAFFTEESCRELDYVSLVDEYMITRLYAR